MQARYVELGALKDYAPRLKAGDFCYLSGELYTARDAAHLRLLQEFQESGKLPYGLEGKTLFYAGPAPAKPGRATGAIGPTTASRMDSICPTLMRAGIVASIGKGTRSEEVRQACIDTKGIYFATIGGIAAALSSRVLHSSICAYEDLGPEAIYRLEVKDFPVFVAYDCWGADLYEQVREGCEV